MTTTSGPWRMDCGDAGVLAPGRWFRTRVVAWTALLFALAIGALFTSSRFAEWLPALKGYGTVCALNLPAAVLLLYAVAVNVGERRAASELALSKAPLELVVGAVAGFAFIASTLLLLVALDLYSVRLGTWRHGWHYLVFNAYISAVLEELAFRAILLRLLARLFGPVTGLVASAALFGLASAGHAPPAAVAQLVLDGGLFLGLLYLVSGRLWLSIGAHVAYDFTEWSLMGVGDKDGLLVITPAPGLPDWLTGGRFGPDGSVLTALVGVLSMMAIMVLGRHVGGGVAASRR